MEGDHPAGGNPTPSDLEELFRKGGCRGGIVIGIDSDGVGVKTRIFNMRSDEMLLVIAQQVTILSRLLNQSPFRTLESLVHEVTIMIVTDHKPDYSRTLVEEIEP